MNDDEVVRVTISESQAGSRIDRVATEVVPRTTRAAVQRWMASERVTVDGVPCRPSDKARLGSVLEIRPDLPPPTTAEPDPSVHFTVVFEDEHLLVVNKPAGLVVHPGRGHRSGTLVNGLLARPGFERPPSDPRDPEGQLRPGIVHRIDKDTSGLLVVAKTATVREGLKEQLASHSVSRLYAALTVGVPRAQTVSTRYGRDPRSRLRFSSEVAQGKTAVTHVSVELVFADRKAARIGCRLETGRTHQIRVHLSQQCKTPLLGDRLYGGLAGPPTIASVASELGRQALHAATLGFVHPVTGERLSFEAELPADFLRAQSALAAQ